MSESKVILDSSDEAAKFVTGISGWVSSDGRFYGDDERLARWAGCTHKKCPNCDGIYERSSWCKPCQEKKNIDKFNSLEKKQWDGDTPLALNDGDEYFFSAEDLHDFIDEHQLNLADLQLVLCKPVEMSLIDESQLLDDLHEDAELTDEVAEALKVLNSAIQKHPTSCWEHDKYAAIVTDSQVA